MGWIYTQPKPKKHDCNKPGPGATQYKTPGDRWQCRKCQTVWELVSCGHADEYWTDVQPTWKRHSQ